MKSILLLYVGYPLCREFALASLVLLSGHFGLRGSGLETARMSRDKCLMRDALFQHGVSSPISMLTQAEVEIVAAARKAFRVASTACVREPWGAIK